MAEESEEEEMGGRRRRGDHTHKKTNKTRSCGKEERGRNHIVHQPKARLCDLSFPPLFSLSLSLSLEEEEEEFLVTLMLLLLMLLSSHSQRAGGGGGGEREAASIKRTHKWWGRS